MAKQVAETKRDAVRSPDAHSRALAEGGYKNIQVPAIRLFKTIFPIRITLLEDMLGTIPKSKEVFTKFVQAKRAEALDDDKLLEEQEMVPEGEEPGFTGFYSDDHGVYLMDYHLRGFFKEAGNILKAHELIGIKNMRAKIDNFCFIFPRKIFLKTKPDGVLERPLLGMTRQGPRVTLAKSDYVAAGLHFDIVVGLLPHDEITEEKIVTLLDFGQLKGLGQWRNGSWGRFSWRYLD